MPASAGAEVEIVYEAPRREFDYLKLSAATVSIRVGDESEGGISLKKGGPFGRTVDAQLGSDGRLRFYYGIKEPPKSTAPVEISVASRSDDTSKFLFPIGQIYVGFGPPTDVVSAPLKTCPAFPGRGDGHALIPAIPGAMAELSFEGEPEQPVRITLTGGGKLSEGPKSWNSGGANPMFRVTDKAGKVRFYYEPPWHALKTARPERVSITVQYDSKATVPQAGLEVGHADVTVGLWLEVDAAHSRLLPTTTKTAGPQVLALIPVVRSSAHEGLNLRAYLEGAASCEEPALKVPKVLVWYTWYKAKPSAGADPENGVAIAAAAASRSETYEPAPTLASGYQYLTPSDALITQRFGNLAVRPFLFQEPGLVGLRLEAHTWLFDKASSDSKELASPVLLPLYDKNGEPPLVKPGWFFVPMAKAEDWKISLACSLNATDRDQKLLLTSLDAFPTFGQGFAVGTIFAHFSCAWSREDFAAGLRILLEEGSQQLVETFAQHMTPTALGAINKRLPAEHHMTDSDIEQTAELIQQAYTALKMGNDLATPPDKPAAEARPASNGFGSAAIEPITRPGLPKAGGAAIDPAPPGTRPVTGTSRPGLPSGTSR